MTAPKTMVSPTFSVGNGAPCPSCTSLREEARLAGEMCRSRNRTVDELRREVTVLKGKLEAARKAAGNPNIGEPLILRDDFDNLEDA